MAERIILTVSLTDDGRAVLRDHDGTEIYSRASLGITYTFVDLIKRTTTNAAYAWWETLKGRKFQGCPGEGNHRPDTCDWHFGEGIGWRR